MFDDHLITRCLWMNVHAYYHFVCQIYNLDWYQVLLYGNFQYPRHIPENHKNKQMSFKHFQIYIFRFYKCILNVFWYVVMIQVIHIIIYIYFFITYFRRIWIYGYSSRLFQKRSFRILIHRIYAFSNRKVKMSSTAITRYWSTQYVDIKFISKNKQ